MQLPSWITRHIEHDVTDMSRYFSKHNSHYHIALLFRGRKLIAIGHNRVSYRRRSTARTIHAEADVIRSLGDTAKLRGATLVVIRYGGHGHTDLINSKPCPACQRLIDKCQREYGLKACIHS
jgi:hypothetical protein